jgi:hypothetical protein
VVGERIQTRHLEVDPHQIFRRWRHARGSAGVHPQGFERDSSKG